MRERDLGQFAIQPRTDRFNMTAHLSTMILSLRVPVEHVVAGRTEELAIAVLALDGRTCGAAQFTLAQWLRLEFD